MFLGGVINGGLHSARRLAGGTTKLGGERMEPTGLHRPEQVASGTARTLDRGGAAVVAGGDTPTTGSGDPGPAGRFRIGALAGHPVAVHLAVLVGFIPAGIAVTWPRATYLAGRLPATRDAGSYVWGFWWIAHQGEHLSNPWFTRYIAAPTGTQLGLHALMPLPGLLMIPITLSSARVPPTTCCP